jgi:LysM repeat protein
LYTIAQKIKTAFTGGLIMVRSDRNSYYLYKTKSRDDVERLLLNMRVSRQDFAELNGKSAEEVAEGEMVKIPYRLSGCVVGRFYMLNRNDSLKAIARRQKLKVSQLLESNPYLNPARPAMGQVIVLPENNALAGRGCTEYVVEHRDSLSDVLRRYDLSIRELQEENPDIDVFSLRPGQALVIRKKEGSRKKTYVMEENENLTAVCMKFGKSVIEFLKANPNLRPLEFKAGIKIILPE